LAKLDSIVEDTSGNNEPDAIVIMRMLANFQIRPGGCDEELATFEIEG